MIIIPTLLHEEDYFVLARKIFREHYGIEECCNQIFLYNKSLADFVYFTDEVDEVYDILIKYRYRIPPEKRYSIIVDGVNWNFFEIYKDWLIRVSAIMPLVVIERNSVDYNIDNFKKDKLIIENIKIARTLFFRVWP